MNRKCCLGVHYTRTSITAVLVEKKHNQWQCADELTLPIQPDTANSQDQTQLDNAQTPLQITLAQLADRMQPTGRRLHPVALAVDAALYNTQTHHSDFHDLRQVRQTLRFDIEDDFAIDAESVYLCYEKIPPSENGTDLMVHTIDKNTAQNLLTQFEHARMDPLVAEPDMVSWLHYLKDRSLLPPDQGVLVAGRSVDTLYLLVLDGDHRPLLSRSYYCTDSDQALQTLQCEANRSLAVLPPHQMPQHLLVHLEGFTEKYVGQLAKNLSVQPRSLPDSNITKAFAAGAAIGWLKGHSKTDFRADGYPPQTAVRKKHRALMGCAAALTGLLLAIITVMHSYTKAYQNTLDDVQNRMIQAYTSTHPGLKRPDKKNIIKIPSILRSQLNKLNAKTKNQATPTLANSASNNLTLILQAFDSLPVKFDLAIDSIRLTGKSVELSGSVPNIVSQVELDKAIEANSKLTIEKWDFTGQNNLRRTFNMSLTVIQ